MFLDAHDTVVKVPKHLRNLVALWRFMIFRSKLKKKYSLCTIKLLLCPTNLVKVRIMDGLATFCNART